MQDEGPYEEVPTIVVERYKYILNQIHVVNENVYRFFAIFQALATAMVTAALGLFVGYSKWGISADTARTGVRGVLVLTTAVAAFTVLMVVIGILSWLDYRREECELTEKYFVAGFRTLPRVRNFYRWYETYIVFFIVAITAVLWILGESILVARIR